MPFIRLVLFCADVVHDFMSQNGPYIAAAISLYIVCDISIDTSCNISIEFYDRQ